MARITAYEATDGTLHRDRKEYLRHESNLLVIKKLGPILDEVVRQDGYFSEEEHQEAVAGLHAIIVYGIGLNTLRELFTLQFKPGAEEGEEPVATAATPVVQKEADVVAKYEAEADSDSDSESEEDI